MTEYLPQETMLWGTTEKGARFVYRLLCWTEQLPRTTKQLQRHITATGSKYVGGRSFAVAELKEGSWFGGEEPLRPERMTDVKTQEEALPRPGVEDTYSFPASAS